MDQADIIDISKALANDTRYKILQEIPENGEKCCKDLSECFDVSGSTVTHHINRLRELGLIEGRKEQTFHYLRRNKDKLNEYRRALKTDFDL